MKTKKFGKKLELNKTTITNLETATMKNAFAGQDPDFSDPGGECEISFICGVSDITQCNCGCDCGCGCPLCC